MTEANACATLFNLGSEHPRRHPVESFFTEAIADVALGQDVNGVSRIIFNFLSELVDDNAKIFTLVAI